ncbi:hypothetical protein [Gracilibacillus thailandensis]|uniref:Uncharacterized protein n=1 Tax=Gracilibacillus thailandensis TaxID=563735 RepID=A0A6N7R120_9BACI|nr:hypothetical protein [Gracilibacillus thailandensis]MRI66861.1 hypothetical protein [Gracilibacillus thailandensis]
MRTAYQNGDTIQVVFLNQKNEDIEEAVLNNAQITALFQANQVWIERFEKSLKIKNSVWSLNHNNIVLRVNVE